MEIISFTFVVFAATYIAGQSKISYPFRVRLDPGSDKVVGAGEFARWWLLALLECNACLAFHLGWLAYVFHLTPPQLISWWIAALYCCATSLILAQIAGLNRTDAS